MAKFWSVTVFDERERAIFRKPFVVKAANKPAAVEEVRKQQAQANKPLDESCTFGVIECDKGGNAKVA
jgi:hypothetical protein